MRGLAPRSASSGGCEWEPFPRSARRRPRVTRNALSRTVGLPRRRCRMLVTYGLGRDLIVHTPSLAPKADDGLPSTTK